MFIIENSNLFFIAEHGRPFEWIFFVVISPEATSIYPMEIEMSTFTKWKIH